MYDEIVNIRNHIKALSETIGPRIFRSLAENKAAKYIGSILKRHDLDGQYIRFKAPGLSDHIHFLLKGIPAIQIRWMDDPWYPQPEYTLLNVQIEKIQKVTSIVTKTIESF